MLESAWLFIGVVALCSTAVAVSTKTQAAALFPNDDGVAIMSGITGVIAWGVWTYGALDVSVAADGTIHTFSMPSVAYFGVAMALIPAYIALTGPADIINRYRNADATDV